ncbi:34402_t:CDS:2, partial [Racocetra persica]
IQDDDMMFVDDVFDYPLAYSFSFFKQSEKKIVEIWELYDEFQDKDLGAQPLVGLSIVFLSKPMKELLIPTTILQTNDLIYLFSATGKISSKIHLSPAAKKSMQKKKAYAEIIRIARKAINIAIEKDNSYILNQKTNISKEYSESNIIFKDLSIKVSNPIKKTKRGCLLKIACYQLSLES